MILLEPLAMAWRGLNRLRRSLYRRGVLPSARLPRPVISVGNLSAGGAGKTPAVIAIARDLTRRGFRVAVLTRGYGRATKEAGLVASLDAVRFGDEPVLIKMSVPEAAVIVGRYRYLNAVQFLSTNDCDVFLLDDGFQHLQLARELDLVVESTRAGWRREGHSALRDADFVLPRSLRITNGDLVRGKRVFAFSGLADNEQFFETVAGCGAIVAGSRGFRDHHRYTARDLASIRRSAAAASAEILVTTQKDAVKLTQHDIIALVAEMVIDPSLLETIAARIAARTTS